jgi:hypothetical protein
VPRLPLDHEQRQPLTPPDLEVRIDTLVLEGTAALDPAALEGDVQQALAALVASGGPTPAAVAGVPDLSARLAAAVYDALPGSVPAAGPRGSEG